jgi:Kef-type K+ transport system membrane component KefB
VASGARGEFGPILLTALVLSSGEGEHGSALVLMRVFTAIIVAGAYVALKFRPSRVIHLLQEKMHTSAQLPVRLAILVLASLVILARNLGLDAILGALAGGVVALASPGEHGETLRLGLLSATQLPLVVAIAGIGVKSGRLKEETAASLVGAGMASVLLFPIATLARRRRAVLRHAARPEVAILDKLS